MKADLHGSPSEQAFARMGWVPAREAKKQGRKPCAECKHFQMAEVRGGDGYTLKPRCRHTMTFGTKDGQATGENASCAQWERPNA